MDSEPVIFQSSNSQKKVPETDKSGNVLVNRVLSYSLVNSVVGVSKNFYNSAKEYKIVRLGVEQAETGYQNWVAPRLQPILENATVQKYSHQAEVLGCSALDKIDQASATIHETYSQSAKSVEKTLVGVTEKVESQINSFDTYLRDSVLGVPFTKTLDLTESVVDRFILSTEQEVKGKEEKLEEEEEEVEEKEQEKKDSVQVLAKSALGPIKRTQQLTLKLKRDALFKLKHLSFLSSEKLPYVSDILHYAENNGVVKKIQGIVYDLKQKNSKKRKLK